jgi:hypothetical protein
MNRGRVGEERGGKEMDGCLLTVMDLVISFHWVQCLGQEGNGVPRIVADLLL